MARWFGQIFVSLLTLSFPASLSLPQHPVVVQTSSPAIRSAPLAALPKMDAKAIAVIDGTTGALLFAQAADTAVPLASITKLMTALVVVEANPDWQRLVTLQESDQRVGGQVALIAGEQVSVADLFTAMLVASSNEAAVAMSRASGLSHQAFVAAMNRKARDLGLFSLHFVDVAGLEAGNVGSARDVARLGHLALQSSAIAAAVKRTSAPVTVRNTGEVRQVQATNQLLQLASRTGGMQLWGGKTGYLDEVGYNIVAVFADAGNVASVALMGVPTSEMRFQQSLELGRWIFTNYDWPSRPSGRPALGG